MRSWRRLPAAESRHHVGANSPALRIAPRETLLFGMLFAMRLKASDDSSLAYFPL
jgi:hypothetical protein